MMQSGGFDMINTIRRRLLGGSLGATALGIGGVMPLPTSAATGDSPFSRQVVFATTTAMRAFQRTAELDDEAMAVTKGYTQPYDGGGNAYFWEPMANQVDDRIFVIRPDHIAQNQPGRWRMRVGNIITPEMAGAVGDGKHDDTQALNYLLVTIANQGGGTVHLTRDHLYRIASGDLNMSARVIIQGNGGALTFASGGTETWLRGSSGFLLDPRYSIKLGQGGALRDVFVMRDGLPWRAPSWDAALTEIDRWYKEDGTNGTKQSVAIVNADNGEDTQVSGCSVVGFNTAIRLNRGRHLVENFHFDCANGIEVTQSGDTCRFYACHGIPLWTSNLDGHQQEGERTIYFRPGIGFNFHDRTDGHALFDCLALYYRIGYRLSNTGGVHMVRCYADNHVRNARVANTPFNVPEGTIGFLTENMVDYASFTDCVVVACTFAAVLNHSDANYATVKPGPRMATVGIVAISGGFYGGLNASTPARNGLIQLGPHSRGSINDVTILGAGCPAVRCHPAVGPWQISNLRLSLGTAKPWLLPAVTPRNVHVSNILDLDDARS
jgi:hypothetical protein